MFPTDEVVSGGESLMWGNVSMSNRFMLKYFRVKFLQLSHGFTNKQNSKIKAKRSKKGKGEVSQFKKKEWKGREPKGKEM